MAMKLDPKGERTIGVITKIDIMDRGTNAKKMLSGEDIPLNLGYVGVKGRSQADIQDGMKVNEAIREEKKWFAQHPVYSNMPQTYLGTEALINKLTTVMYRHIKKTMPSIIAEIDGKVVECEKNIKDLGTALPVEEREKLLLVWKLISDFSDKVKAGISGEYNPDIPNIKKDLLGGVRIKMKFNDVYLNEMSLKHKASKTYKDSEIKSALRLHMSNTLPGFTSSEAFNSLMSPLLQKLREPAMSVLEEVHVIMEQICIYYINETFQRFPMFINEITDATLNVLQADKERARLLISEMIDANIGYTYTKDPDYLAVIMPQSEKEKAEKIRKEEEEKRKQEEAAKAKAAATKGEKGDKAKPSAKDEDEEEDEKDKDRDTVTVNKKKAQKKMEEVLVKEMRNRIDAYYRVVATQLADIVPKLIGHNLVNSAMTSLQFSVFKKCSAGNMFDLLKEPEHIVKKRETLKKILEVLTKSRKILLRDPDLAYNVQLMSEKDIKEEKERKKEEKKKKGEKGFFAKAGEFASDVGSKISTGVSDLKNKIVGKDEKPLGSSHQSSTSATTAQSSSSQPSNAFGVKPKESTTSTPAPQTTSQPATLIFGQKTEADLAMDAAKFAYQNKEAVAKFAKENPELANKAGNAIINAAVGAPAKPTGAATAATTDPTKAKKLMGLFG